MSTDQNEAPVEAVVDDLDAFSADFFGQKSAADEQASSTDNADGLKPVDDAPDATEDTKPDDKTDKDDEKEPEEVPKKTRYQERIDELTAKQREAERKAAETEAKYQEVLAKLSDTGPKAAPVAESAAPGPEDTNEDGSDKYPLGEFDPQYIRDLTRFTIKQERDAYEATVQAKEQDKAAEVQRAELQTSWDTKLGPAKERYPDFQEKGEQLLSTLTEIPPAYGEYLSATLMSMDFGPDVLYYLATNPDEAAKIVNSGATKATIALGRLEAKFAEAAETKQAPRPKVSAAPEPPPANKGTATSKSSVSPDTDDLDAFATVFFKK